MNFINDVDLRDVPYSHFFERLFLEIKQPVIQLIYTNKKNLLILNPKTELISTGTFKNKLFKIHKTLNYSELYK